ncbi:MAG: ADP-ribosylglycohydrolase family protein [Spirochaetaceae bacterium]|nr:MAG: ADP-ribosylglycohydrolase family protein [Spirochaetaceae bacterium]
MAYSLYEHILGGLLGQACGDAFAMSALLHPKDTWRHYGGWLSDFQPGPEGHPAHEGLPAARVTDDTEQAFALAARIIREGGVTVEGAAAALLSWYESVDGDNAPFVGPSTRKACQALKRGEDPRETGRTGDTNGGAMRICPVGLIHPGDPAAAVRDTALACCPSHFTDVAVSAAAAVAAAVAAALQPGISLQQVIAAGRQAAVDGRTLGSPWFGASIPRRIDLALDLVRGADVTDSEDLIRRIEDLYDLVGSTLAASEAVPSAFGILRLAEGDPLLCARYAAALSGDADTVAAMACAIAGSWRGADAFPDDRVAALRRGNPDLDFEGVARGLTELAERQPGALRG